MIKKIFVLTSNQNKKKKIKMVSFGQREVILIKIQIEFYIR